VCHSGQEISHVIGCLLGTVNVRYRPQAYSLIVNHGSVNEKQLRLTASINVPGKMQAEKSYRRSIND
jgi:hypothetical protein